MADRESGDRSRLGNGRDWFERLSQDEQKATMGPGLWEAWKDGRLPWRDMVKRTEHPVWGVSVNPAAVPKKGQKPEPDIVRVLNRGFVNPQGEVGTTYSLYTGQFPRKGLVFAPGNLTEKVVEITQIDELVDEMEAYWLEYAKELTSAEGSKTGNNFGLWFNGGEKGDNKYYLDVSVVWSRSVIRDVIEQCAEAEQWGFYDLESQTYIPTSVGLDVMKRMPNARSGDILKAIFEELKT